MGDGAGGGCTLSKQTLRPAAVASEMAQRLQILIFGTKRRQPAKKTAQESHPCVISRWPLCQYPPTPVDEP
jgi:hypothetical protein